MLDSPIELSKTIHTGKITFVAQIALELPSFKQALHIGFVDPSESLSLENLLLS